MAKVVETVSSRLLSGIFSPDSTPWVMTKHKSKLYVNTVVNLITAAVDFPQRLLKQQRATPTVELLSQPPLNTCFSTGDNPGEFRLRGPHG